MGPKKPRGGRCLALLSLVVLCMAAAPQVRAVEKDVGAVDLVVYAPTMAVTATVASNVLTDAPRLAAALIAFEAVQAEPAEGGGLSTGLAIAVAAPQRADAEGVTTSTSERATPAERYDASWRLSPLRTSNTSLLHRGAILLL